MNKMSTPIWVPSEALVRFFYRKKSEHMGILGLFKKKSFQKKTVSINKANHQDIIQDTRRRIEEDDREIAQLQAAKEKYDQDNDVQACIQEYEKVLLKGTSWNSFNFHLTLVNLYVKADRDNDGWAYLNRLLMQFPDEYCTYKIRYEQFHILKKEKKYKEAIRMLAVSHVLKTNSPNGSYFSIEKFEKDGKTTAKGAKMTPESFHELACLIEETAKGKKCTETDVFKVVDGFLKDIR